MDNFQAHFEFVQEQNSNRTGVNSGAASVCNPQNMISVKMADFMQLMQMKNMLEQNVGSYDRYLHQYMNQYQQDAQDKIQEQVDKVMKYKNLCRKHFRRADTYKTKHLEHEFEMKNRILQLENAMDRINFQANKNEELRYQKQMMAQKYEDRMSKIEDVLRQIFDFNANSVPQQMHDTNSIIDEAMEHIEKNRTHNSLGRISCYNNIPKQKDLSFLKFLNQPGPKSNLDIMDNYSKLNKSYDHTITPLAKQNKKKFKHDDNKEDKVVNNMIITDFNQIRNNQQNKFEKERHNTNISSQTQEIALHSKETLKRQQQQSTARNQKKEIVKREIKKLNDLIAQFRLEDENFLRHSNYESEVGSPMINLQTPMKSSIINNFQSPLQDNEMASSSNSLNQGFCIQDEDQDDQENCQDSPIFNQKSMNDTSSFFKEKNEFYFEPPQIDHKNMNIQNQTIEFDVSFSKELALAAQEQMMMPLPNQIHGELDLDQEFNVINSHHNEQDFFQKSNNFINSIEKTNEMINMYKKGANQTQKQLNFQDPTPFVQRDVNENSLQISRIIPADYEVKATRTVKNNNFMPLESNENVNNSINFSNIFMQMNETSVVEEMNMSMEQLRKNNVNRVEQTQNQKEYTSPQFSHDKNALLIAEGDAYQNNRPHQQMNKVKKDPILFKMKLDNRKSKKDDDMKSIDLSSIIIAVSDHENDQEYNIEKQYRTQKITTQKELFNKTLKVSEINEISANDIDINLNGSDDVQETPKNLLNIDFKQDMLGEIENHAMSSANSKFRDELKDLHAALNNIIDTKNNPGSDKIYNINISKDDAESIINLLRDKDYVTVQLGNGKEIKIPKLNLQMLPSSLPMQIHNEIKNQISLNKSNGKKNNWLQPSPINYQKFEEGLLQSPNLNTNTNITKTQILPAANQSSFQNTTTHDIKSQVQENIIDQPTEQNFLIEEQSSNDILHEIKLDDQQNVEELEIDIEQAGFDKSRNFEQLISKLNTSALNDNLIRQPVDNQIVLNLYQNNSTESFVDGSQYNFQSNIIQKQDLSNNHMHYVMDKSNVSENDGNGIDSPHNMFPNESPIQLEGFNQQDAIFIEDINQSRISSRSNEGNLRRSMSPNKTFTKGLEEMLDQPAANFMYWNGGSPHKSFQYNGAITNSNRHNRNEVKNQQYQVIEDEGLEFVNLSNILPQEDVLVADQAPQYNNFYADSYAQPQNPIGRGSMPGDNLLLAHPDDSRNDHSNMNIKQHINQSNTYDLNDRTEQEMEGLKIHDQSFENSFNENELINNSLSGYYSGHSGPSGPFTEGISGFLDLTNQGFQNQDNQQVQVKYRGRRGHSKNNVLDNLGSRQDKRFHQLWATGGLKEGFGAFSNKNIHLEQALSNISQVSMRSEKEYNHSKKMYSKTMKNTLNNQKITYQKLYSGNNKKNGQRVLANDSKSNKSSYRFTQRNQNKTKSSFKNSDRSKRSKNKNYRDANGQSQTKRAQQNSRGEGSDKNIYEREYDNVQQAILSVGVGSFKNGNNKQGGGPLSETSSQQIPKIGNKKVHTTKNNMDSNQKGMQSTIGSVRGKSKAGSDHNQKQVGSKTKKQNSNPPSQNQNNALFDNHKNNLDLKLNITLKNQQLKNSTINTNNMNKNLYTQSSKNSMGIKSDKSISKVSRQSKKLQHDQLIVKNKQIINQQQNKHQQISPKNSSQNANKKKIDIKHLINQSQIKRLDNGLKTVKMGQKTILNKKSIRNSTASQGQATQQNSGQKQEREDSAQQSSMLCTDMEHEFKSPPQQQLQVSLGGKTIRTNASANIQKVLLQNLKNKIIKKDNVNNNSMLAQNQTLNQSKISAKPKKKLKLAPRDGSKDSLTKNIELIRNGPTPFENQGYQDPPIQTEQISSKNTVLNTGGNSSAIKSHDNNLGRGNIQQIKRALLTNQLLFKQQRFNMGGMQGNNIIGPSSDQQNETLSHRQGGQKSQRQVSQIHQVIQHTVTNDPNSNLKSRVQTLDRLNTPAINQTPLQQISNKAVLSIQSSEQGHVPQINQQRPAASKLLKAIHSNNNLKQVPSQPHSAGRGQPTIHKQVSQSQVSQMSHLSKMSKNSKMSQISQTSLVSKSSRLHQQLKEQNQSTSNVQDQHSQQVYKLNAPPQNVVTLKNLNTINKMKISFKKRDSNGQGQEMNQPMNIVSGSASLSKTKEKIPQKNIQPKSVRKKFNINQNANLKIQMKKGGGLIIPQNQQQPVQQQYINDPNVAAYQNFRNTILSDDSVDKHQELLQNQKQYRKSQPKTTQGESLQIQKQQSQQSQKSRGQSNKYY